MIETSNSQIPHTTQTDEDRHTFARKISLGAHHLCVKGDQSIELMHIGQEHTQPEYVLCFDSIEAYRLMVCLCELFKQPTNG